MMQWHILLNDISWHLLELQCYIIFYKIMNYVLLTILLDLKMSERLIVIDYSIETYETFFIILFIMPTVFENRFSLFRL